MRGARRRRVVLGAVGVLAAAAALWALVRFTGDRPVEHADPREHFKYGSTGGERGWRLQPGFGVPYWIWVALPELFPDLLPGEAPGPGYTSFGMLYEPGRDPRFDLPVGMSMRRVQGIDRIYFNCASCHTGSIRDRPGAEPRFVLGMPANTFDLGLLGQFLFDVAVDVRFTPERLTLEIARLTRLRARQAAPGAGPRGADWDLVNRSLFRLVGVHLLREQLLTLRGKLSFVDMRTWGPGRVDTFNMPKALLGFPVERLRPEELRGNCDFPSVWFQQARAGMQLHWDGNNTSVDERNLSAGFGTGATPTTLDRESVLRMAAFLWDQAEPTPFPPERIDARLAARGEPIYGRYCLSCHGAPRPPFRGDGFGERVGTVVPIEVIGTDRRRLDSYTPELAQAQGSLYAGFPADEDWCRDHPGDTERCYPSRFRHFRKTYGYANQPLDGLWLRAPYLHNGSVPDLRSLLEPAERRPAVFYTGDDLYDYEAVGFVSDRPGEGARPHFRFDTSEPGNSRSGHEGPEFGTELDPGDKEALIEYLKTF